MLFPASPEAAVTMPALHNDTRQHMHTHTHACVCASLLVMMYMHHHVRCGAGPRALTTTHAHGRTRRHACPRMSCKTRTCTCAHNACNDQLIESAEPLRLGAPTPLRCRNTCARLHALVGITSRNTHIMGWRVPGQTFAHAPMSLAPRACRACVHGSSTSEKWANPHT